MKILVNTRLLIKDRLDGIGWFSFETLKRITQDLSNEQFFFTFDRPFSEEFIFSNNIEPIVLSPPTRHPLLWYYWFEYRIPILVNKLQPDLFVSPDGYLSLKSNVKSLAVIHDINFLHYPKDLPFTSRLFYNRFFPLYAKKATRLATVSEYSKMDIADNYGIKPEKIDVLYNGYNTFYQPIRNGEKEEIKKKYTSGVEYFIFIGSLHPRKNIVNMLKAFDSFRKSYPRKMKFVIVGENFFMTKEITKTFRKMKYRDDVIFAGRLEPSEIKNLLSSALALVLVSKFEGFGIPVIEAFKCDTPVIVSNSSSLPEIAGDAAIYAQAFSIESICDAMLQMAADAQLRQKLIENGRIICQKFSWDKTAKLFKESMFKSISG